MGEGLILSQCEGIVAGGIKDHCDEGKEIDDVWNFNVFRSYPQSKDARIGQIEQRIVIVGHG